MLPLIRRRRSRPAGTVTGRPAARAPVNTGDASAPRPQPARPAPTRAPQSPYPKTTRHRPRHQERIKRWPILEHFERRRAGACNDIGMAVGDEHCAGARGLLCAFVSAWSRVSASMTSAPVSSARRAWHPARTQKGSADAHAHRGADVASGRGARRCRADQTSARFPSRAIALAARGQTSQCAARSPASARPLPRPPTASRIASAACGKRA